MQTLEAIYKRRSIRGFTEEVPSEEQIKKVLEAAFSAPTAVNAQPWEYIVITEKEILDKIRGKMKFAGYNANTAIVVCGNMKLALKGPDKDLWVCDCSAAIENMLLAATDIGLASVWLGLWPVDSRIKQMRQLLDIPEHVVPLSMVYLGYGEYELEGRCRYNEKAIYWQKYDPSRKHRKKDKPIIGHYS